MLELQGNHSRHTQMYGQRRSDNAAAPEDWGDSIERHVASTQVALDLLNKRIEEPPELRSTQRVGVDYRIHGCHRCKIQRGVG